MRRRMVIMLAVAGLVFGAVFGFQVFKAQMIRETLSARKSPPQTVAVATAGVEAWQEHLEAVGNVRAVNGANLSAEVSGTIAAIHFKSGAVVKKGDLLVELTSAADAARLDALRAAAVLARLNHDRTLKLLRDKSPALSQVTADTTEANLKSADAQVAQQKALLDYKFIRAPFPGRLGIVLVDLGQYIAAGTPVVPLQQTDPIYIEFYVPQQALARIRIGQKVTGRTDTYPDRTFAGAVTAIDSVVDPATRNIKVRATFPNPDMLLVPGMFATIGIDVGGPQRYLTLPLTAVSFSSYGDIVFVVEKREGPAAGQTRLVARQVFVTTGPKRGGQVAIMAGVKEGDAVVVAGQIKLRNDTPVVIDNSVAPSANPKPTIVDE